MKSFNKTHPNSLNEMPSVWNPPDLNIQMAGYAKEIKNENVLALFGNEEKSRAGNRKGKRSALQPMGTNQNFTAWQPDDAALKSDIVHGHEWSFIEIPAASSDELEKTHIAKFFSEEETADQLQQINLENEAPMILERARLQAEEIILAAQAEADDVLLQAQTEIDDQKKQAYCQGMDDANLEMEDVLKAAHAMVEEIGKWETDLISQGEKILVDMLKEMSRKMFGEGVELDAVALQANLSRVMDSAHGLGGLNIFLNPKDARKLDSAWVDQHLLISGGQAKIIPSVNITRGGCFVKGNMGTVDGRVETQLDAFLKTIDEASVLAD